MANLIHNYLIRESTIYQHEGVIMTVILTGLGLTIEKVVQVARRNEKIKLHPDALKRIKNCRAMLEKKIKAREIMYGVNTGVGELSEVVLTDNQIKD